ncbi:alpha/beta fold hydrolase [Phaeovulum sp.]|uniref:alpha/beta fold hydrolase n=1 Tax=Phaeovulum sp. TaxID=2934796 RepID=UPI0039E59D2D
MAAEPLLLLPGMMCDAHLFWHQIIAFSSTRPVLVAPLTEGSTIEEMADAVLQIAPPVFAVAGHWLGGLVAMEILRRVPDRVARIALLDVSPLSETPQVAAQREARIVRARSGKLIEALLDEVPAQALAPGPGRIDIQAMMLEMAEALGPDVFQRQSRALMRRPDQQRTLRNTRVLGLLACGEHDTLCPPRRHEFLAELMPNADFRLIRDAGHLAPLEQPEAVTAVLQDWLDR